MKERPILFSSQMVRAILAGLKTQTRRVANVEDCHVPGMITPKGYHVPRTPQEHVSYCPHGKSGDRLWVRETFALQCDVECENPPFNDGRPLKLKEDDSGWLQPHYRATDPQPDLTCEHVKCDGGPCEHPWRPSIFMPRWASRITLEITKVRVERLQDISHRDALAEGVEYDVSKPDGAPLPRFHLLWDSINAKRGFGWDKNPWTWVLEFKRVTDAS